MRRVIPLIIVACLLLTACQAASEELAEQIIEQSGDGNVDIDIDSGEVSIQSDDGSVTFGGGEVPNDFPVPFPDGYDVRQVATAGESASVALVYAGDRFDELVAHFESWTAANGTDWTTSTNTIDDGAGGTIRAATWYDRDLSIQVNTCPSIEDTGQYDACVLVLVE